MHTNFKRKIFIGSNMAGLIFWTVKFYFITFYSALNYYLLYQIKNFFILIKKIKYITRDTNIYDTKGTNNVGNKSINNSDKTI